MTQIMEVKSFDSRSYRAGLRTEEGALALLCEFEYPGNVRTLRNLIYELTSYVDEDEPISIQLVQFALAKLSYRIGRPIPVTAYDPPVRGPIAGDCAISSGNAMNMRSAALHAFLRDLTSEGDIILPIDLCVLRREETFKQWTDGARKALHHRGRENHDYGAPFGAHVDRLKGSIQH